MELISRAEVITAIVNTPSKPNFDEMPNRTAFNTGSAFRQNEIIDIIKELPTVESRPTSRWIDGLDDRGFYNRCANCGYDNVESYYHRKSDMTFCPKCGAEILEGDET